METGAEGENNRNINNNDRTKKPKRQMKTRFQLATLESSYASAMYPSEAIKAQLSKSLGLTDRQLQMWFCHRRIKDKRKETQMRYLAKRKELLKSSEQELVAADRGSHHGSRSRSHNGSRAMSRSGSGSGSSSGSSQFNEPLVHSRADELTHQEMMLRSLVDCVEVELGQKLRDDEETQDVEQDSETEEETSIFLKRDTTTTQMKSKTWILSEEVALADAWLNASKDPANRSKKHASSFWGIVLDHFKTSVPDTKRTASEMHSKWNNMGKNITRFDKIFNRRYRGKRSGQSEADILKESLMEYQGGQKQKRFKHIAAWKVIRNQAKQKTVPSMGAEFEQSAKRSKTSASNTHTRSSEDGVQPMDLGIDNEESPSLEEVERSQHKSTSTGTQVLIQMVSKLNSCIERDAKKLDRFRSEKLRIKEEEKEASIRTLEAQERAFKQQERLFGLQNKALERQEKKEDLELFLKSHDHLSGPMLRVMLKQKQEIAQKWGWEWE